MIALGLKRGQGWRAKYLNGCSLQNMIWKQFKSHGTLSSSCLHSLEDTIQSLAVHVKGDGFKCFFENKSLRCSYLFKHSKSIEQSASCIKIIVMVWIGAPFRGGLWCDPWCCPGGQTAGQPIHPRSCNCSGEMKGMETLNAYEHAYKAPMTS